MEKLQKTTYDPSIQKFVKFKRPVITRFIYFKTSPKFKKMLKGYHKKQYIDITEDKDFFESDDGFYSNIEDIEIDDEKLELLIDVDEED